jgi:hypothetical protein
VADIPEHILRRSAEARAKAEGRSVEEVLAELKGEAPPAAAESPVASSESPEPSGEASKIPEALLRRTAEARAKKEGRSVDDVMAELTGQAPAAPAAEAPAPAAEAPAPAAAATAPAASGPVRDLESEAAKFGVPADLLQRAMVARARKDGKPIPQIAGQAAPPPVAAAAPAGGAAAAPAVAAVPEGVRTQRLLTVVKAGAIQQVKSEPTDKVNVWPHLLAIEFVALMACLAFLIVFSTFVDAPLLEFANFNEQPNPSKAPWYFLGLQELLSYFDPQVAGVILPGFGLGGLAIIPYIDRNPSVRPSDRKLAIMIFTFFVMSAGILTIFGSFFRGPGFNFTFPWVDGLYFDF